MKKNRITSLDSLKGVAAVTIILFHILIAFPSFHDANYYHEFNNIFMKIFTWPPLKLLWSGQQAVLLFFILSGFFLGLKYKNYTEKPYKAYVLQRLLRLYMPYIIIMIISGVLATFLNDFNNIEGMSRIFEGRWANDLTLETLVGYLLMVPVDTSANGVVWQLYHEFRISIFLPFFLLILRRMGFKKGTFINLSLSVGAFVLFHIGKELAFNEFLTVWFTDIRMSFYYGVFVTLGAYIGYYYQELSVVRNFKPSTKFLISIGSLFLIINRWFTVPLNLDFFIITDTLSVIGLAALIIVILNSKTADRMLDNKVLLWLGKNSFSIYLVHIPVMMICNIFLSNIIGIEWSFVIAFLLVFPTASIVNKTIIIPTASFSKRVENKLQAKQLVSE